MRDLKIENEGLKKAIEENQLKVLVEKTEKLKLRGKLDELIAL